MNNDEMGVAFKTYGETRSANKILLGELERRNKSEDPVIDERILKWILEHKTKETNTL